MRLPRFARLAAAATATLALVIGGGISAQAVAKDPPVAGFATSIAAPGCTFAIDINNGWKDCTALDSYKATLSTINAAIASNDPAARRGALNGLMLTVFGGELVNWEGEDPGRNLNLTLLDEFTSYTGNPSNSTLACYGDALLRHISTFGAADAAVKNIYNMANTVKDVKDKIGAIKDMADLGKKALNFYHAFGDEEEMQKILIETVSDATKDKIEEEIGWNDDMFDLYITMFTDSERPVTYYGMSDQLRAELSPVTGCETASLNPMPSYVTKTKTVHYTAQAMFKRIYAYDGKNKGKCKKISGGALQCTAYDDKRNKVGGYALCGLSVPVRVPAAVKNAGKPGGVISAQMSIKVAKLKGAGYWDMGFGYLPKGTFKKAGLVKTPTIYLGPDLLQNWLSYGFCLKPKAVATIKSIDITYRSTILKAWPQPKLNN